MPGGTRVIVCRWCWSRSSRGRSAAEQQLDQPHGDQLQIQRLTGDTARGAPFNSDFLFEPFRPIFYRCRTV